MVVLAQLVRASDCGSEGRRFEPGIPPKNYIFLKFYGYLKVVLEIELLLFFRSKEDK